MIKHRGNKIIPERIKQADLRDDSCEALLKEVFEELLEEFCHTYLIVDGLYQCTREALDIVKYYPLELIRRDQKRFRLSLLTTSPGYRQVTKIINCDGPGCTARDLEVFYTCECNEKDFDLCRECMDKGVTCPESHESKDRYDTVRIKVGGHNRKDDIIKFCRKRLDRESTVGSRVEDERHHVPAPISTHVGRFLSRDDSDDQSQTETSTKGKFTSDEKKDAVAKRITRNAQGNFFIANAWLDDLFAMNCEPEELEDLLQEVDCLSKDTLKKIFNAKAVPLKHCKDDDDRQLASRAISLAMAAFRPLNILAFQHALSLGGRKSIASRYFADRASIVRAANGLLCIDRADPSNSFVRLFHPSFCLLASENDLPLLNKKPHLEMAHLCLDYLEHEDFVKHSKDSLLYPFLSYALEHWGDHVREAGSSDLDERTLRLLKNTSKVKEIAKGAGRLDSRMPSLWINDGADAIRLCAWYNVRSVIQEWRFRRYPIHVFDDEDESNPATICYACVNANLETVEELLDIEPTTTNDRVLSSAIRNTIEGLHTSARLYDREVRRIKILKILLSNANRTLNSTIDYEGSTVLIHAVKEECYNFVAVLLKTEPSIDVNIQDSDGRSALCHALRPSLVSPNRLDPKAHKDIIEMLDAHPSASRKAMTNTEDHLDI